MLLNDLILYSLQDAPFHMQTCHQQPFPMNLFTCGKFRSGMLRARDSCLSVAVSLKHVAAIKFLFYLKSVFLHGNQTFQILMPKKLLFSF